MKGCLPLVAIIAVVLLETSWFLWPRLDLALPHSPETIAAIKDYQKDPSDLKKANVSEQIQRDILHNIHHNEMLFGLMILGDVVAFYYWWKLIFKKRQPAPQKSEEGVT
jgi:hypothetical protein